MQRLALYHDLGDWYRLLDPPLDHADEVESYRRAFESVIGAREATLLELGAGAGHNAFHLKSRFRCTLSDVSEPMLALSRALNPECEHVAGDMRTLRLDRTFDAVLVHDAIMYMTTRADLEAAIATAYAHTAPGGAAVFAPDGALDTFVEHANLLEADQGLRSLRGLEWAWDPNPADEQVTVEYALLMREGGTVRSLHERHVCGLFRDATWLAVLRGAGYVVSRFERPLDEASCDRVFLARRP